jgi:tetratricopeptide (TPR) repeat protein
MCGEWLHRMDQMKHLKSFLRSTRYATLFALLMLAPIRSFAQDPPPPPPDKPAAPREKPKPPKTNADNATQSAPDQPTWDPLRAEKDMQVGIYYMHKGDVDAAIDRFQDATLAKPGYAVPFRYLAEAQEKKGMKKQAIKSYKRYLDLFPTAEDKDKIQKKIDKLYKDVEKEKKSMN